MQRSSSLAVLALAARPARTCGGRREDAQHAAEDYMVGMAARSVSLGCKRHVRRGPVYLGGYGLGNGACWTTSEHRNPGRSGRQRARLRQRRGRPGNLADGIHVRAAVISAGRQSFAIADIENQGCFTQNKQGYGLVTMRLACSGARKAPARGPRRHPVRHSHGRPRPDRRLGWRSGRLPEARAGADIDAIVEAFETQRPAELWYGTAQSGVAGATSSRRTGPIRC